MSYLKVTIPSSLLIPPKEIPQEDGKYVVITDSLALFSALQRCTLWKTSEE